jgi:hypothetical protein
MLATSHPLHPPNDFFFSAFCFVAASRGGRSIAHCGSRRGPLLVCSHGAEGTLRDADHLLVLSLLTAISGVPTPERLALHHLLRSASEIQSLVAAPSTALAVHRARGLIAAQDMHSVRVVRDVRLASNISGVSELCVRYVGEPCGTCWLCRWSISFFMKNNLLHRSSEHGLAHTTHMDRYGAFRQSDSTLPGLISDLRLHGQSRLRQTQKSVVGVGVDPQGVRGGEHCNNHKRFVRPWTEHARSARTDERARLV